MGYGSDRWLPQAQDLEASRTIKRAVIHHNTSGNNTIVAAVTGKKIKVVAATLVVAGAVNVRFESDADGTALTGIMQFGAAGEGFVWGPAFPGYHWIETAEGELLNLELSGAVYADGIVLYYEE